MSGALGRGGPVHGGLCRCDFVYSGRGTQTQKVDGNHDISYRVFENGRATVRLTFLVKGPLVWNAWSKMSSSTLLNPLYASSR
jgi:hypothetical protein